MTDDNGQFGRETEADVQTDAQTDKQMLRQMFKTDAQTDAGTSGEFKVRGRVWIGRWMEWITKWWIE